MINICPSKDYVLIKPEEEPAISDIIALPDNTQAKAYPRGEVMAVGPEVTEVGVGDTVHFERFDHSLAPGGCIIIKEDEILAVEG